MDLNRSNLTIEIQELVLVDVPVSDGAALKQTVAQELIRLIETQGIPNALGQATNQANVTAGPLTVSGNGSLGMEIAQAIYQGLGGGLDR